MKHIFSLVVFASITSASLASADQYGSSESQQDMSQRSGLQENPGTYSDSQLQSSEAKYPQDFAANAQDRQINAKIRDALSNTWFSKDYETLMISTTGGVVVITGTVYKMEDKQKVGDQVKAIDGVRSVNNQLTVKNN
jgi:osmotically-inducible protein OsmY